MQGVRRGMREHKTVQKSPQVVQHRKYFDWLGDQLGIQKQEDWYKFRGVDVAKRAGVDKMRPYGNSLPHTLVALYPEYEWHEWRFPHSPLGYWDVPSNRRRYFAWLGEELGLEDTTQLIHVKNSLIAQKCGAALLEKYGNALSKALQDTYPEHDWNTAVKQLSEGQKKTSDVLQSLVSVPVLVNYRHPELMYSSTPLYINPLMSAVNNITFIDSDKLMELDVYLPTLHLALEYQGGHHYTPISANHSLTAQQKRDEEKRIACKSAGITLIEVPYWWEENPISLIATIQRHRPDIHIFNSKQFKAHHHRELVTHTVIRNHFASLNVQYKEDDNDFVFSTEQRVNRRHFDWLAEQLGVEMYEDWYKKKGKDVSEHGAWAVLVQFNGSLHTALSVVYPEYDWYPWLFPQNTKLFWEREGAVYEFFQWLSNHLGLETLEDWYRVSTNTVKQNGGKTMLVKYFRGSLLNALNAVYPYHQWRPWLFRDLHHSLWNRKQCERAYCDWLADRLNITTQELWYQVTLAQCREHNGHLFLAAHNNSLIALLASSYPEFSWLQQPNIK